MQRQAAGGCSNHAPANEKPSMGTSQPCSVFLRKPSRYHVVKNHGSSLFRPRSRASAAIAASAMPTPRPNNKPTQKPLKPPAGPVRCSTNEALTATKPTTASARQEAVCRRGTVAKTRFHNATARRHKTSTESFGADAFDISLRPASPGPGRGAGAFRELRRGAEHTMCGSEPRCSGGFRRIGNHQRSRSAPAPRPGPEQRRYLRQPRNTIARAATPEPVPAQPTPT